MPIVELEDALSISLVERNNRAVLLTTGQRWWRERAILTDVDDVVSLCEASEPFQGTIRLGVIPTIAPFILPTMLKSLRAQHGLQVIRSRDLSQALVDALQVGDLDVLLLALPFPAEHTDTLSLFEDPFILLQCQIHDWR